DVVVVAGWTADGAGALVEGRLELMGLAAEEAVEVIEAASGRPLVEGAGGRRLPVGREVPLAEGGGRVAPGAQVVGERRRLRVEHAALAGMIRSRVQDGADAHRMGVATGQERGTGRGADGGRVEAVVAEAVLRQP